MSSHDRFLRSWLMRGAEEIGSSPPSCALGATSCGWQPTIPTKGSVITIESIGRWSQKGFHRQHYSARLARVQTALYRGDAETAWRLFTEQESMMRRSLLTRVRVLRIESLYLRARCALAMAASRRRSRRFLSVARVAARRIAGERMPWSDPIALLVRAGIANLEGRHYRLL